MASKPPVEKENENGGLFRYLEDEVARVESLIGENEEK
jgi:hypothetical protein